MCHDLIPLLANREDSYKQQQKAIASIQDDLDSLMHLVVTVA